MAKGYYISKNMATAAMVLAAIALVTIIALSIVYNREKSKNAAKSMNVTTSMVPPTPKTSNELWDKYRLPDTLVPHHYNVTLWPRLVMDANGMYVFTGNSSVIFTCLKKTDLILIHANKLNLTLFNGHHAKLMGLDGVTAPAIKTTWFQTEMHYLVIQLNGNLKPGKSYWLYTEFRGELADDLEGFYRSEYMEDGRKKIIAITQMQATYARKAFPCFDEPAMKAVFHITLIHDPETMALSNGQEIKTENLNIDGITVTRTTFEPTKKMSTYLVAFVVSDFTYIKAKDKKGVLVRIWARKKAIEEGQGNYALSITQPILEFFEMYYNTSYPLSKSDQIALPDFKAGAMENWGLITYRETALLYDAHTSANGNKQRIVTVVSHELAHMWFGNLVTLKWWNDLWLNEGFASYVEYLGADHAEPTWNIKDQIILYDLQRAFAVDSLTSSHPLSRKEEEVNTPSEISEMFNTISYSKGAAVLRMLSQFLTERVFAKGLGNYLKQFAFGSTVHSDLWDHLQKAADQTSVVKLPRNVHDIMNRWILQMGLPVVTIDTRNGNISQKHFLLDSQAVVERKSEFNYEWFVPIKWMKNGQVQDQLWLLQKSAIHKPMKVSKGEWVLANLHASGYFRVNYDLENWERLLSQLESNHEIIPVVNRAQLLDDAFNVARASVINVTLALRTTKYLLHERDYIPWEAAWRNLNYFFKLFDRSEVYGAMQVYVKKQVKPLFKYFGTLTSNWTTVPSGHTDQFTQIIALSLACSTGVEGCRDLTKSWFRRWMQNPHTNTIHPNLRSTVYCNAIAAGGAEEWDFGWKMFQNATVAAEAVKLRAALACTKVPWLLNRYLEYTLNPEKIRKQDATSTIGYIASNVIGQPLAWDFVRANWDYIFKVYGAGSFTFSRLIGDITYRFCTSFELSQLKRFQKDNAETGFGSGTQTLQQAIEKTTAKIKWLAENKEPVLRWFISESA
ncbi:aminopeptidase Ey [Triplophysa rosa]|uniref:Aminopeptidase n=1 Tax=Triplophysa rosa TaxID=992332 RepID=A0A9W8CC73_TRIRA|nr:aminopeptidase Ey [Triplophysa rosa]XP_057186920.1 aminopeptidase Ey [Triplophysa rosa]XP_057186928.1 aminopeptidase Ey [Triplophysa rosa]KAI7814437.1 putative aminopeptidase N-like [Triplophysa rosa]